MYELARGRAEGGGQRAVGVIATRGLIAAKRVLPTALVWRVASRTAVTLARTRSRPRDVLLEAGHRRRQHVGKGCGLLKHPASGAGHLGEVAPGRDRGDDRWDARSSCSSGGCSTRGVVAGQPSRGHRSRCCSGRPTRPRRFADRDGSTQAGRCRPVGSAGASTSASARHWRASSSRCRSASCRRFPGLQLAAEPVFSDVRAARPRGIAPSGVGAGRLRRVIEPASSAPRPDDQRCAGRRGAKGLVRPTARTG